MLIGNSYFLPTGQCLQSYLQHRENPAHGKAATLQRIKDLCARVAQWAKNDSADMVFVAFIADVHELLTSMQINHILSDLNVRKKIHKLERIPFLSMAYNSKPFSLCLK